MTHLIDKDAVIAEIERRIASLEGIGLENYLHDNYPEQYAMLVTLKSLKFSIDNLEVKEADLEKEIELVKGDYEQVDVAWNNDFDFIAKHFFELGLNKAQKGE